MLRMNIWKWQRSVSLVWACAASLFSRYKLCDVLAGLVSMNSCAVDPSLLLDVKRVVNVVPSI